MYKEKERKEKKKKKHKGINLQRTLNAKKSKAQAHHVIGQIITPKKTPIINHQPAKPTRIVLAPLTN
jgi:hypothetical protein